MANAKIQLMWWQRAVSVMLVLAMFGNQGEGAICPAACRCENEILKASCPSGALQVVPIQLNPELHELDLSNNKITSLHIAFSFYERLKYLNLSTNKLKTLGNSNLIAQKNLTHLDISNNQIGNLTKDSLKGLKALTYLDISNNSLEEINSVAFRELHSLSVVRLSGNKLVHLDEGLFRSGKNLKELYLSDNSLLEVPTAALTDVVHLQFLSLSRNLILTIADGDIPNLPELHVLLLNSNVISNIHPDGFSSLLTLNHIDLSDNNLTVIPTTPLTKLSVLHSLKLGGNFIRHIPPVAFRGLFHLKILKLDRLETLHLIDTRAFVDNIYLEKIHMDYNVGIKKLPTRLFHGNPNIKYISVRFNKLQTLEAIHFPIDQLHDLRVGGNPLNCNCSLGWLWQLIQEYKLKTIMLNETSQNEIENVKMTDLNIDVNDIACTGPEALNGLLLADASESQMDCSVGWTTAISITVTVIFILTVIGGVVYWAPKRKTDTDTKEQISLEETKERNRTPEPTTVKQEPNELAQIEKYIMPPPTMMQNEYRSLESWEPYGASSANIYEELNETKDRHHIVYV